jgi:hypothetical protein
MSPELTALAGVVVGALATGLVSSWLERRRERVRLGGVLGLLVSELRDNRDRLERGEGRDTLTYGDWHASKAAFSQLMRDQQLWEDVVTTYGQIYEARNARREAPAVKDLGALADRLNVSRERLRSL